ncbi:MAG: metallophosphoesterase [Pigmentiphaga sp.]
MQKTLIIGDLHGEFAGLNQFLHRMHPNRRPDLVLQVGDFGFFPNYIHKFHNFETNKVKQVRPYDPRKRVKLPADVQLHWTDGNHEDHRTLAKLVEQHGYDRPIEVARQCFYQPRGSHMTLEDGRVVLFLGGAFSVDHQFRNDHHPDLELLDEEVLDRLPPRIDIVISHTAPTSILQQIQPFLPPMPAVWDDSPDPSCDVLQRVLWDRRKQIKHWFFGHLHHFQQGETPDGCRWTALSCLGGDPARCSAWLPEKGEQK